MEETPIKIELKTSDKSLFNDLVVEKIPGVKIGMRMGFTDCAESTAVIDAVVTLSLTIIGGSAGNLLVAFLKERFIDKPPKVAIINNTNIVNNIESISVIINNIEKDVAEKDEGN